jgi:hypothetical protein
VVKGEQVSLPIPTKGFSFPRWFYFLLQPPYTLNQFESVLRKTPVVH